jgi:hypothetical protein
MLRCLIANSIICLTWHVFRCTDVMTPRPPPPQGLPVWLTAGDKALHPLTRLEYRRPRLQLYDLKAVEVLLSTGTLSLKRERKSLCNREEGS